MIAVRCCARSHGWGRFMIKQKSQILALWFLLWDLAWTAFAWLGAYYLRFSYEVIPVTKATPEFADCARHIPLLLILAAVAYRFTGQYVIHRFRRLREEFVAVAKGTALMGLFAIAVTFSMQDPYESRMNMLLFLGLTAIGILTWRRLSWFAIRWLRRRGFNQTHAIIVGTGRVARKTARALRQASWMGIKTI